MSGLSHTSESWIKEDELALKSDIPHVPTRTSELDNDSGFTTQRELDTVNQNLNTAVLDMQNELGQKASKEYVDDAIGNVLTQEEF